MDNNKTYSYFEHFNELRSKVILCLIVFFIIFIFSYFYSDKLLELLLKPLFLTNNPPKKVIYTEISEAFISHIKLTFIWSLLLTTPFILYQFYLFIAPGLYLKEKKAIRPFFVIGILLFLLSCFFTYNFIFPNAWNFFANYQKYLDNVPLEFMPKVVDYVNICIQLILIFGLVFQLPLLIILLAKVGIINNNMLKKFRKPFIVSAFILAAILTPPDIFSQIALAIPIILLYEISIIYIYYIEKGKKNA